MDSKRSNWRANDGKESCKMTRMPALPNPSEAACKKTPKAVDPYDPLERKQMIESARVEIFATSRPGLVHCHKSKAPPLWTSNQQRRKLKKPVYFRLDAQVSVEAVGFLGSGAFAQVFSVKVDGLEPAPTAMALKCEKNKSNLLWELYVTQELSRRTKPLNDTDGVFPIPRFSRLDVFKNGALLLMEKAPAGTLHDLLNAYKKAGRTFPETLAIHYAIRMLYIVETIHEANILHGDIKPDNWLVVPTRSRYLSPTSSTSNDISSSTGSLRLIDFGRSIDMDYYPEEMTFHGDCHVKNFQTIEMKTGRPWTTQIDTFGVCATVHCMLFGDYMDVAKKSISDGSVRWRPTKTFKRYWQVSMWEQFFDAFLNVESCDKQPSLASARRLFERFFQENEYRQEELRELLSSQERMLSKPKV